MKTEKSKQTKYQDFEEQKAVLEDCIEEDFDDDQMTVKAKMSQKKAS